MLLPALIAAAVLAIGVAGHRRTRSRARTTDYRQRHRAPRRPAGPSSMEQALRTAAAHAPTVLLPAGPETVAIPRIDGTMPVRPARIRYPEWDTRA